MVDLILIQHSPLGWALDLLVMAGAGVLLVAFSRAAPAYSKPAWALSAVAALSVMTFVFDDVVPDFSHVRSIHAAAEELHQQRGHPPVMYFARHANSATLHLAPSKFAHFGTDQMADVGQYLQDHSEVILVTTPDGADQIRHEFGTDIDLAAAGGRGRLYVATSHHLPTIRVGAKEGSRLR